MINIKDNKFKIISRLCFYEQYKNDPSYPEDYYQDKKNKSKILSDKDIDKKHSIERGYVLYNFLLKKLIGKKKLKDNQRNKVSILTQKDLMIPFADQEITDIGHQSTYFKRINKYSNKVSKINILNQKYIRIQSTKKSRLVVALKNNKETFNFLVKYFNNHNLFQAFLRSSYFKNYKGKNKLLTDFYTIINGKEDIVLNSLESHIESLEIEVFKHQYLFMLFLINQEAFKTSMDQLYELINPYTGNKIISRDLAMLSSNIFNFILNNTTEQSNELDNKILSNCIKEKAMDLVFESNLKNIRGRLKDKKECKGFKPHNSEASTGI